MNIHLPDVGARLVGDTLIIKGECIHIPHHLDLSQCELLLPAWLSDLTEPCEMCCPNGKTGSAGLRRLWNEAAGKWIVGRCPDCIGGARLFTITDVCQCICHGPTVDPRRMPPCYCDEGSVTVFEGVVARIDDPNDDGEFVVTLTPKEGL